MIKMSKNKEEFEELMLNAFRTGMTCGYAVEHAELSTDEEVYTERFRAYLRGDISSMSEPYNNRLTYTERASGCGI